MKKRIIFCDFDGTLVDRHLIISPKIKKAIRSWKEAGNYFTVASGRQFGGVVDELCAEFALHSPQITMGGGEIVDPVKKRVLHAVYLPENEIARLIKVLYDNGIEYWLERIFKVYTKYGKAYPKYFGNVNFFDQKDVTFEKVPKMGIFGMDGKKETFVDEKIVKEFPLLHVVKIISDIGKNWDITAGSATKHTGVLQVMELLKIPREDTIGIGDGNNDFPLLTACGYKVAMGNAGDSLKGIADFIAPTQKEDGVAVTIEKLLEEQ